MTDMQTKYMYTCIWTSKGIYVHIYTYESIKQMSIGKQYKHGQTIHGLVYRTKAMSKD